MPLNLLDLPTELSHCILSHLKPSDLFHKLRLVNHRFHYCVETFFRLELLPNISIDLLVYIEDGVTVNLTSCFSNIVKGAGTVRYKVRPCDQKEHEQKAKEKLYDCMRSWNDGFVMKVCLPPSYLVTLRGREWQDFTVDSEEIKSGILELEWKKLVAVYFKRTNLFDDIADGTSGRGHVTRSRFPMY